MGDSISKSLFKVAKMDCAAEESLIRMRLGDFDGVNALEFDLTKRTVSIYHNTNVDRIAEELSGLRLGSTHVETILTTTDELVSDSSKQQSLLVTVLLINLGFFAVELTSGLISNSMGLIADSLDMLADALVYGVSLLAVGASIVRKKSVARWSGYFQIFLALIGIVELLRRAFGMESVPDYRIMIIVSVFALIANGVCLYLLQRSDDGEAHMQASMIFTSNDIVINVGVILAAVLVLLLDSNIPDLIVGAIVFLVVIRGAFRILALSK